MKPATTASIAFIKKSLMNGKRNNHTKIAPRGSLKPVMKDQRKAFFLLLLLMAYIGIATAMPSGILCNAIAIVNITPSSTSFNVPTKVAMPSGKL